MAYIEVPRTIEVAVRGTLFGQQIVNILNFQKDTTDWLESEAATFAEDLTTWMLDYWLPNVSISYTMDSLYITDISEQNSWVLEYDIEDSGESATESLPPTDAVCVTFKTNNRGRSFRGRCYVAGIGEGQCLNGRLADDQLAAWQTWWNNLSAVTALHDCSHVIVSRVSNGAPRVTAVCTPVSTYRINQPIATQRRRRIGSGS